MSLGEHLGEIRRRIFYVIALYLVFVVVCFVFIQDIVSLMLTMVDGFNYVYLSPTELIMSYMRLSLVFALVVISPFIAYHVWAFVKPALTKPEKRICLLSLLGGFLFFVLGLLFSYYIVLPFTLNFLIQFNSNNLIVPNISVDSYTKFIVNMLITFGLVFEMPVLSFLLSLLGILKPRFLIAVRKYAVLVILIIAAFITPPDAVSQIMVAIPMVLLYQVSIQISRIVVAYKERNYRKTLSI